LRDDELTFTREKLHIRSPLIADWSQLASSPTAVYAEFARSALHTMYSGVSHVSHQYGPKNTTINVHWHNHATKQNSTQRLHLTIITVHVNG